MNNMTPLQDKVLIQLLEKQKVTASGILLTQTDPAEATRGKVIAVGPEALDVSVGDVILPNWNKATKISKTGDEEYYIIKEEDIVLVFEE